MQRVWSTYLVGPSHSLEPDSPNSMTDFSHRSLRRQDSFFSDVNSTNLQSTSARHLLRGMNFNNNSSVDDYTAPFTPSNRSAHSTKADDTSLASTTNLSLSVNYIPSKFSGFRNRKGGKYYDGPNLPKSGGGIYAFGSNQPRMSQGKGSLRWNKFKWVLFATNSLLTLCSVGALVVCLLTWFDVWDKADVVRTGNTPELILSTLTALIGLLTSLIGWAGILLNNRSFLAWYTFLTWVTFAFLVTPGYLTYKRLTFNLEGKINAQWSRNIDTEGRLRIQNQLNCCGYFSPFVEATVSQTCYARSILPGCKGPYLAFERKLLLLWYKAVFALVPAQVLIMVAGLMCSNHITYRFGKGMMPEAYRLNMNSMAVIMDNYADQLADQYGANIANTILKRNRSKTLRDSTPTSSTLRYSSHRDDTPLYPFKSKYSQQSSRLYHAD